MYSHFELIFLLVHPSIVHKTFHTHIDKDGGVNHTRKKPARQEETHKEEQGIELATFRLPAKPALPPDLLLLKL